MSRARILADYVSSGDELADKAPLASPAFTGTPTGIVRDSLAADIIDGTKLADDAVNSEHVAADSLDAEHYAAGSVDATAIANDAVDSQHYAAGSIDNEHLANDAVGTDELANDVVINTSGAITTTGAFTSVGTTNLQDSHLKILTNSADADDNNVWFQKSRHATDGSHTIVQDNDDLGSIIWDGSDGDSFETAAKIIGRIDGSPSAGSDMPGSLEFQTSGEGSASPTTRMVINSSGKVNMGTSSGRETTPHQKLIVGSSIKVGCGNHTPPTGAAGNFFGIDIQITANNVAQVIKTRTHSEACFYLICGHCSSDRWTDLMCTGPGTVYPIDQRTTQGSGITRSYSVSGENLYFTINDSSRSWSVFVTAMGANETSTTSSPCEGSLAV